MTYVILKFTQSNLITVVEIVFQSSCSSEPMFVLKPNGDENSSKFNQRFFKSPSTAVVIVPVILRVVREHSHVDLDTEKVKRRVRDARTKNPHVDLLVQ